MFALSVDEFNFLRENLKKNTYNPDFETSVLLNDVEEVLANVYIYLLDDECMYYDYDEQNQYTEKGKYVQSLYDKILDWKYL